eukprot:scaffold36343_cov60-Phaeocystis_antarctica.AAC.4
MQRPATLHLHVLILWMCPHRIHHRLYRPRPCCPLRPSLPRCVAAIAHLGQGPASPPLQAPSLWMGTHCIQRRLYRPRLSRPLHASPCHCQGIRALHAHVDQRPAAVILHEHHLRVRPHCLRMRAAGKRPPPPVPPPRSPAAPPPPPPAPSLRLPLRSAAHRAARALRAAAAASRLPPSQHPRAPSPGPQAAAGPPPAAAAAGSAPRRHHPQADRKGAGQVVRRHLRQHPCPAAASRSRRTGGGHLRAGGQMGRLRAARRGLAAVLAAPLKGRDRPLNRPVPVGYGYRLAALGAAARLLEAVPAVGTVAVALVALVHLALGQREAHRALQGLLRQVLVRHWASCFVPTGRRMLPRGRRMLPRGRRMLLRGRVRSGKSRSAR